MYERALSILGSALSRPVQAALEEALGGLRDAAAAAHAALGAKRDRRSALLAMESHLSALLIVRLCRHMPHHVCHVAAAIAPELLLWVCTASRAPAARWSPSCWLGHKRCPRVATPTAKHAIAMKCAASRHCKGSDRRGCLQAEAAQRTPAYARFTLLPAPDRESALAAAPAESQQQTASLASLLQRMRSDQLRRCRERVGTTNFLVPAAQGLNAGRGRWVGGMIVAEACLPWPEALLRRVSKLQARSSGEVAAAVAEALEVCAPLACWLLGLVVPAWQICVMPLNESVLCAWTCTRVQQLGQVCVVPDARPHFKCV